MRDQPIGGFAFAFMARRSVTENLRRDLGQRFHRLGLRQRAFASRRPRINARCTTRSA